MRKALVALVVLAIALIAYVERNPSPNVATKLEHGTSSVADAFENRANGVEVEGEGTVSAILRDDDEGSRHQRFILRLDSGRTLLISHNIDLARRVSPLRPGDRIEFRGEYVWNDKGGLVHWTHRDPAGHHPPGWLKRDGETFE